MFVASLAYYISLCIYYIQCVLYNSSRKTNSIPDDWLLYFSGRSNSIENENIIVRRSHIFRILFGCVPLQYSRVQPTGRSGMNREFYYCNALCVLCCVALCCILCLLFLSMFYYSVFTSLGGVFCSLIFSARFFGGDKKAKIGVFINRLRN